MKRAYVRERSHRSPAKVAEHHRSCVCLACRAARTAKCGSPDPPLSVRRRTPASAVFTELLERMRSDTLMWPRSTLCRITGNYLARLYAKQRSKCSLTGIPMLLQEPDGESQQHPGQCVGVDLLWPKRGYVKGNVRLVCRSIAESRRWAAVNDASCHPRLVVSPFPESWGPGLLSAIAWAHRQRALGSRWSSYPWRLDFNSSPTSITWETYAQLDDDKCLSRRHFCYITLNGSGVALNCETVKYQYIPVADKVSREIPLADPGLDILVELEGFVERAFAEFWRSVLCW